MFLKAAAVFVCAFLFALPSSRAEAASASSATVIEGARGIYFSLGAEAGMLSGSNLYHITVPVNEMSGGVLIESVESELEFPLNSAVGGLNMSLGKKEKWSVDASFRINLTRNTGKTLDSDWFTANGVRDLFVYSESDTDMKHAYLLDARASYFIVSEGNIRIGPVAGYKYQDFAFDVENLFQTDLSTGYVMAIPGTVATYDVTYGMPYAGIALDLRPDDFDSFALKLTGIFGWAFTEDKDDHILRSKMSVSEADGPFYEIDAVGDFTLSERLAFYLSLEYLKLKAQGTQTQTFYATTTEAVAGTTFSGIDYYAESTQLSALAGLRWTW